MWSRRSRLGVGPLLLIVTLVACDDGGAATEAVRSETGEIVTAGDLDAFDLRVGDCFDVPEDTSVVTVEAVPCEVPHDREVFANFIAEGESYPGGEELESESQQGCAELLVERVGDPVTDPGLGIDELVPTRDSWESGERTITCFLEHETARLEGSVLRAFIFEVGDCFDDSAVEPHPDRLVGKVPCDGDHHAEVFHTYEVPDADTYPGDDVLGPEAQAACLPEFETYVGRPFAIGDPLTYAAFFPNESWWDLGDRRVFCYAYDAAGGRLESSVRAQGS